MKQNHIGHLEKNYQSLMELYLGVIQGIFEISNHFWANKNHHPNFDKLTKNKVFTKPLTGKQNANHKLPSMYTKHCKPVF